MYDVAFAWLTPAAYVVESEDAVLGESQPLSELLLVKSAGSSAAAAIDISRSSSGTTDIQYIHNQTIISALLDFFKQYILNFGLTAQWILKFLTLSQQRLTRQSQKCCQIVVVNLDQACFRSEEILTWSSRGVSRVFWKVILARWRDESRGCVRGGKGNWAQLHQGLFPPQWAWRTQDGWSFPEVMGWVHFGGTWAQWQIEEAVTGWPYLHTLVLTCVCLRHQARSSPEVQDTGVKPFALQ